MRKQAKEKTYLGLSVHKQCELLNVPRSSMYYQAKGESEQNLELMRHIDKIHTEEPSFGVLRIQDALMDQGVNVGEKRIRRLMHKMGVQAIYPKRNLSKLGHAKYVHPYLLRNYDVKESGQVWAIDITYIPMRKGFMYMTAVIDLHSRYLVGWHLGNSLDAKIQTNLIKELVAKHGKPQIINSDQVCQYTTGTRHKN